MNCPACQSIVPDTAKFCLECGSNLSGISLAERGRVVTERGVASAQVGVTPAGFSGDTSLGDRKTIGWTSGVPPQASSPETPVPFVLLASRYDLQEPLGSGGFATVFKALDRNLQRPVAIKRLHAGDASCPETALAIERFLREALAVAQLSHRNIVTVYEQARDDQGHYIVMELMTEGTLHDHYRRAGKLSVAEAVRFIRGICRGLSYAHRRNLVHRDIKPRNILLAQEDGELVPKIVDFGLARMGFDSGQSVSQSGYGLGTPCYMPPEQRRDAKSVNHTADIYAVGKTLYELVTGELPENVDPELLADQPELSRVIFRCIKTRPEERYFSVDELIADLEKLPIASASTQPTRPQTATSIDDLVKRNACPNCGASNKTQDRFCLQCGTGLVRKCPECDRENSAHVRYCGSCGTDAEAMLRIQDAAAKMESYAADRRWSRVVKEYELAPQDARIPGEKGRRLVQQLKTMAETASSHEAEIEQLSAEIARSPSNFVDQMRPVSERQPYDEGDDAHEVNEEEDRKLLQVLLRLDAIASSDGERNRMIVVLQTLEADRKRCAEKRRQEEAQREAARQAELGRQESERQAEKERLELEIEMARVRREAERAQREREANRLLAEAKECIRGRQWEAALQRLSQVDPEFNKLEHTSLTAAAKSGAADDAAHLTRIREELLVEKSQIEALNLPAALDEAIRRTLKVFERVQPFTGDPELQERGRWAARHLADLQARKRSQLNVDDDFEKAQQALALRGNSRHYTESVWQSRLSVWNAAAEGGDPRGMWLVADCHLDGIGGPRDVVKAFALFSRAAQLGLSAAEMTLGRLYLTGTGVPEDVTQAVNWWRNAADRKDPAAVCELARCYLKGRGVAANPAQAIALLREPSVQNDARVLLQLGLCYNAGQGVSKDPAAGYRFILKSAQLGKSEAMYHVGIAQLAKQGNEKNRVRDVRAHLDAIDWLKKAAELGNVGAVTKLEELGIDAGREVRTNSIGMLFVRIPQGGFRMGSPPWTAPDHQPYRDENPEHHVQITNSLFVSRCPVTQEQYQQIVGKNPSKFKGLLRKTPSNPVETVSWFEAVSFCNLLSAREGCSPYYRVDGSSVRLLGGDGYRLLTEAEWEYACRARTTGLWFWGGDEQQSDTYSWVRQTDSDKGTHPVGEKKPNRFGLFDMLGNVWEWCWDWFDPQYYARSPGSDPTGPEPGTERVVRGGSWDTTPMNSRCAIRDHNNPNERFDDIGFRVARNAPSTATAPLPRGLK